MKYQALLLVIAILFSTFMLRLLGGAPPSPLTQHNSYQIQLPAPYNASSSQGESFRVVRLDGSVAPSPEKKEATSSPTQTAVIENPTITTPVNTSFCNLTASIFLVRDVTNSHTIISQNAQQRWPIASVSKLMTTLIAYDYMNPKEVVTITQAMHDSAQGYASLEVGASYSVNDLMRAALVVSSNDATYALADTFGFDSFIAKMNSEAQLLGMRDTSFFEPSGLSYLNQSTVSDIALLLHYINSSAPELFATTRKQTVSLYNYTNQKNVVLSNIDYFAGTDGFIGGKTGFITESGGNLVTLFNKQSHIWAVEVFDSADRFKDIQKLLTCAQKISGE